MKTTSATRLVSFFLALVLTAGTLAGINGLAESEVSPLQLARVQVQAEG